MRRGLYRVRGTAGLPDDVRVEDDGIEMPLEESLYRARGYRPLVEDLPWQEDYLGKRPAKESPPDPAAEKTAREEARREFQRRFQKP